jgi:hypothetical protein
MHTERFTKIRRTALAHIFTLANIKKVWKDIVRNQLRSMDIKDLYDHYDFNYNITERSEFIRGEVLSGNYKISAPFIYRLEQKFGICRHIIIPQHWMR